MSLSMLPKQRSILTVGSLASKSCIIVGSRWERVVPRVVPHCTVVIQAVRLPGQVTLSQVQVHCLVMVMFNGQCS